MRITVNDEARDTQAGTVEALVEETLGEVPEAGTAVALNGEVVPRSQLSLIHISEPTRPY